jgi:hypothetical protein
MTHTAALVKLGQFMMQSAPNFKCDVTFNNWARVGQALSELDSIFSTKLRDFPLEDQTVVREAAAAKMGRVAMPETLVARETTPRRTRRARMTRVMSKADKPVSAKTSVDDAAPKRRGRPRKVV